MRSRKFSPADKAAVLNLGPMNIFYGVRDLDSKDITTLFSITSK